MFRQWVSALAILVLVAAAFGTAQAGGSKGSLGVGAEYQLSGLGGLSGTYDMGQFHVGAFLGFSDGGGDDDTDIDIGGRFFYHVHSTAMSDFGVGGSLGIGMVGDRNTTRDDNQSRIYLEPSAQIRAFFATNVAVSFTAGLSIAAGDAEGFAISGQPVAAAGVHYYFF